MVRGGGEWGGGVGGGGLGRLFGGHVWEEVGVGGDVGAGRWGVGGV